MPTKDQMICVLSDAGVEYPATATLGQIRNLYEAVMPAKTEEIEMDSGNTKKTPSNVSEEKRAEDNSVANIALQEKIDQLELEKKLLVLQKEVSEMKLQSKAEKNEPDFKTIESLVPPFSGQNGVDIVMWFEELERVFGLLSVDEKQKLVTTLRLLSGTAQEIARSSGLFDYSSLKQTLIDTFQQTYSVESVYHQLRCRRLSTSESIIKYFIDMKSIARKAKIPEGELIDIIIEGIDDPVNTAAMRFAARRMDDLLPMLKRYEEIRSRHPPPSAPTDKRYVRNASGNSEQIKCYNCLQLGHYQSQCQRPQRPYGSCLRCSQTGHSHRECPSRSKIPAAAVNPTNENSGFLQQIQAMQEEAPEVL
ncbi:uncharacterized protein LOC118513787 [Anopheles stephensi]|uniref:uncharacterized protein LOC118513787 n=1 Tax=Anopheles stephensi TaxID=30069 RepID=UPI001658B8E5|nr:uncharacterized protein LOC118513787 [Anopheles stephensi]